MKRLQLGPASIVWTAAADGPLGHNPPRSPHDGDCCGPDAVARRSAVHPGEWVHLTQVHGSDVVVAVSPSTAGATADAAVTEVADLSLAVATADCAPIAIVSSEGIVAAVHAGWRGLESGVIASTARTMRSMGATSLHAALGPCIHAECYEFGADALGSLVERWGGGVAGRTADGAPALDLPAAVDAACAASGVDLVHVEPECTACSGLYFSHRARGDTGRQVMLVRRDA